MKFTLARAQIKVSSNHVAHQISSQNGPLRLITARRADATRSPIQSDRGRSTENTKDTTDKPALHMFRTCVTHELNLCDT